MLDETREAEPPTDTSEPHEAAPNGQAQRAVKQPELQTEPQELSLLDGYPSALEVASDSFESSNVGSMCALNGAGLTCFSMTFAMMILLLEDRFGENALFLRLWSKVIDDTEIQRFL